MWLNVWEILVNPLPDGLYIYTPTRVYFPLPLPKLKFIKTSVYQNDGWTSLVVQWLRIFLPMQGTGVQSLVREDPTCCGATKPVRHNYWACALEPLSHKYWAHTPQLLKPAHSDEDPTQPKIKKKRKEIVFPCCFIMLFPNG